MRRKFNAAALVMKIRGALGSPVERKNNRSGTFEMQAQARGARELFQPAELAEMHRTYQAVLRELERRGWAACSRDDVARSVFLFDAARQEPEDRMIDLIVRSLTPLH